MKQQKKFHREYDMYRGEVSCIHDKCEGYASGLPIVLAMDILEEKENADVKVCIFGTRDGFAGIKDKLKNNDYDYRLLVAETSRTPYETLRKTRYFDPDIVFYYLSSADDAEGSTADVIKDVVKYAKEANIHVCLYYAEENISPVMEEVIARDVQRQILVTQSGESHFTTYSDCGHRAYVMENGYDLPLTLSDSQYVTLLADIAWINETKEGEKVCYDKVQIMVGKCPVCGGEKSLYVNVGRNMHKCRSCGWYGDIVTYLMWAKKTNSRDVAKYIKDKYDHIGYFEEEKG